MTNAAAFSGAYVTNRGRRWRGSSCRPATRTGLLLGGHGLGRAPDPEVQFLRPSPASTRPMCPRVPFHRPGLRHDVGEGHGLVLRRAPPAVAPALFRPGPLQRDRRRPRRGPDLRFVGNLVTGPEGAINEIDPALDPDRRARRGRLQDLPPGPTAASRPSPSGFGPRPPTRRVAHPWRTPRWRHRRRSGWRAVHPSASCAMASTRSGCSAKNRSMASFLGDPSMLERLNTFLVDAPVRGAVADDAEHRPGNATCLAQRGNRRGLHVERHDASGAQRRDGVEIGVRSCRGPHVPPAPHRPAASGRYSARCRR